MKRLDDAHATQVETAGIDWLGRRTAPGKKIATIGWCMGGGQSLNACWLTPDKVVGDGHLLRAPGQPTS